MINESRGHDHRSKDSTSDEDGGVPLPDLNTLSIQCSTESQQGDPPSDVPEHGYQWGKPSTRSWHTQSTQTSSDTSRSKWTGYSVVSGTSVAGSVSSYATNVAERSGGSGVRAHGWIKKSSIPLSTPDTLSNQGNLIVSVHFHLVLQCRQRTVSLNNAQRPSGDDARERESMNAWSSEEEEEEDDEDDSDDDAQI